MNSLGLILCQSAIYSSISCINHGTSRQIVEGRFSAQSESKSPLFCHLHVLRLRSIRALLGILGQKYDQYLDFAQQDAHEFLRILLDAMRMEEQDVSFPPCLALYSESYPSSYIFDMTHHFRVLLTSSSMLYKSSCVASLEISIPISGKILKRHERTCADNTYR